jgi:hypothetical protein
MIFVDSENDHFIVTDLSLMGFSCLCLLRYFRFECDFTLDATIEVIGVASFARCESLSSFSFESGSKLKAIASRAFEDCSSVGSICIPASVEALGDCCFFMCTSVSSFTLEPGSRLTRIGDREFQGLPVGTFPDYPANLLQVQRLEFIAGIVKSGISRNRKRNTIGQSNGQSVEVIKARNQKWAKCNGRPEPEMDKVLR